MLPNRRYFHFTKFVLSATYFWRPERAGPFRLRDYFPGRPFFCSCSNHVFTSRRLACFFECSILRREWWECQLVELVKFAPEKLFVGQESLIFGDESRGYGAAEGVFDDLIILGGAEKDADGRALVRLADVAIECFEIEFHFAEVFGFELVNFEIE